MSKCDCCVFIIDIFEKTLVIIHNNQGRRVGIFLFYLMVICVIQNSIAVRFQYTLCKMGVTCLGMKSKILSHLSSEFFISIDIVFASLQFRIMNFRQSGAENPKDFPSSNELNFF